MASDNAARVPARVAPRQSFNGDGTQDLAIGLASDGTNGELGVLLGTGEAGPSGAPVYPTGNESLALALGDVNGGRKLDVVTANEAPTVSVLLGESGISFSRPPARDLQ